MTTLLRRAMLRVSAETARVGSLLAMSLDGHAPAWALEFANPFLQGGFAPVRDELTVDGLTVRGELPAGLEGTFLRNGPNPAYRPASYTFPFDGDGMIHALSFRNGRANYRNRFIMTPGLKAERRAGRAIYGGLRAPVWPDPALVGADGDPGPYKNVANTNVVHHAGRTLALWEGAVPTELAPDLTTIGPCDFDGRIREALTAHPKLDPETGEMLAYRYRWEPPYLVYFVIDAAGQVVRQVPIDLPAAFLVHDFAITTEHAVFVLGPAVMDVAGAIKGGRLLSWEPDRGTRIAVLRRDGEGTVQWFDTDPFFVFHFMNASETKTPEGGGRITVDYIQHTSFGSLGLGGRQPSLWRLELDLGAGTAVRRHLNDRHAEFPRIDAAVEGRPNRYGWASAAGAHRGPPATYGALARYDVVIGDVAMHDFGLGHDVDEPVFIPRPGARREGEGWIGAYVYDRAEDSSRFVLLDAIDISRKPVAEIVMPRRVPHGFHGNWVPAPV